MSTVEQDLEAVVAAAKMHQRAAYVLFAIVVGLVILFLFAFCRAQPNVIPPKDQTTFDSLKITKTAYDSGRKANVKAEGVSVLRSTTTAHHATTSLHAADSLGALALIAQKAAEALRDTSSLWHAVAILRGKQVDSLHVANDSLTSALTAQKSATAYADQRARLDSARLFASNQLNDRLANDVKTAGQCRVIVLFRCPSRTETAVIGLAAGVVAKTLYDRRKP